MNKEESIQQINELIEAWELNEACLNQTDIDAMKCLLKENQELKEKLDKYENPEDMTLMMMWSTEKVKDENENLKKKYSSTVADYETTMFEKEQLNSLVNSCQEEIRKLKTQLKNKYEKVGTLTGELLYKENTKLINQQIDFYKEILQKYKSIIGDDK